MRKAIITLLIISVLLAGCYTPPRYTSDSKKEDVKTEAEPDYVNDDNKELAAHHDVVEEQMEEEPAMIEETEQEGSPSTEEPDCDGRLIPTYNFRDEITGYRCDTDAVNFECPGHRAGETWQENGAECTCKDNGKIVCAS